MRVAMYVNNICIDTSVNNVHRHMGRTHMIGYFSNRFNMLLLLFAFIFTSKGYKYNLNDSTITDDFEDKILAISVLTTMLIIMLLVCVICSHDAHSDIHPLLTY